METQNDFTPRQVGEAPASQQPAVAAPQTPPAKASFLDGFKQFYQNNKIYFWAIFAGAVIILLLGFFAFRKSPAPPAKQANVKIDFSDTATTATTGGQIVYHINITNQDKQKLTNVQLELAYPNGFSYVASTPNAQNLSGSLFSLPDLSPGQQVAVMVKASANGNINDSKTLAAKLHYQYANFSSQFTNEQDFSVRMTSSDVAFDLAGPTTTNNAQLVTYTLTYQNNSQAEIKNARIQMDYPDGFSFASASPNPDLGKNIWNFSSIAVGGQGTIQILGNFNSATPGDTKTLTANFLVLGDNGQYLTQTSSNFSTAIASVPLLVTQDLVQGGETTNVVNPGDTLSYHLRYQNNNTTAAQGVTVTVTLDSPALDLSSISAQGAQVNNNTITWNAAGVPNLQVLNPNDSGDLNFSVRVKDPATKDSSTNLTVNTHTKIWASGYSAPFPGNDLSLKISSPASFNTSLAFVSGSLPPKVGRGTTYKVSMSLTNSTNDFSDAAVTMYIPAGFVDGSVNSSEQGNTSYDSASGKLTWNLGLLPAHSGQFRAARTLTFNVAISPSADQAFKDVVLVNTLKLDAKDTFTGQPVDVSADDIKSTDLPGQQGAIQGQVQP